MTEKIYPLLVTIEDGVSTAALMSPKGFSKSRENGTLWISHPETGRVLPWQGEPAFVSLEDTGAGYTAVLPAGSNPVGLSLVKGEVDVEKHEQVDLDGSAESAAFLAKLTSVIQERHKSMPEGSYTTHLFNKGMEKIKKKTGEEAVELLLASEKEDILYESADLIYHLLVLLEAADLSIFDVLAELERRDG
ncbi:MAG: phosphoribosyl-ATP diphosphatase [Spirochaetales bacterium]|nr:phosphoribosyl-ATP diphosphatase [Spirochaetales bacterium]